MMRNVEIKAKVRNLSDLLKNAQSLSSSVGEIIKQHDTFYNANHGRLKLRKFESGDAELIQYERPNVEGPKLSAFERVPINSESVEGLHRLLEKALGIAGVVQKVRRLFLVQQTRVHVDSVEGLGDFMELEVVLRPEQSLAEGEQIACNLMEKLGVEKQDLVSGAYNDLLQNK